MIGNGSFGYCPCNRLWPAPVELQNCSHVASFVMCAFGKCYQFSKCPWSLPKIPLPYYPYILF